jgi:hypothetical protein
MSILEDLSTLTPRKLEKRLNQLAKDAVPCLDVWVAEGDREHGLTVALQVDATRRPDVLDLGRVLEEEPAGLVTSAWALLPAGSGRAASRLLLRIDFERPVHCEFVVRFDVTAHPSHLMRAALPLLLAASWFLLVTNTRADRTPEVWFSAPPARDCLTELIAA